jgi:Mg2+-importing ATPase
MKFSEYTIKKTEEVLRELKTSGKGLSEKEVRERLKIHGFNEIKTKEISSIGIFLRQFKSPFFYLIFIAALVAFIIGEIINGVVILFFVVINVSLGFYQEWKAEKAAVLLKKYLPQRCRVKRVGVEKTIDKKFLVPGDIILLEPGNIVPVDVRILKEKNFLVNEEVLSGESAPVVKSSQPLFKETKEIFEAKNIVFAATSIVSGEAEGVVISTGRETFFGEVTRLTVGISRESTYEKNIFQFSKIVLRIVVVTIVVVFLLNLIIKGKENFFDFLIFCIALVVSIIPEALPTVVVFALSQGALKLVKKKVVVKRLSAIEDLGDIEILCTDKTGTLTENKLSLDKIFSSDKEKCLLYGLLASPYIKEKIESSENPFDFAIFQKASPKIKETLLNFRLISEIPFDPVRLTNSSLLEDKKGNKILIVRGAQEIILKNSLNFEGKKNKTEINQRIEKEGREGKRILAVAYKEFNTFDKLSVNGERSRTINNSEYSEEDEKDLTFLGYFSFLDPLKKTAKEAVGLSKKLGVQIKILTGDSFEVAGAVAKEIGLIKDPQREVILAEKLDRLSDEDFEKTCESFRVFARVSPKTKYKIIQVLQKKFETGFLGEGINDAPALKLSNVAIAVESAADISREVSDIVLLKKDLRVIIDGIREGRNIFYNIQKYIKCTLASNFGNFYSIAAISLFIRFLPMLPVQILLVNLLSDFPLIAVATDRVEPEELRKPKFYQLHQVILLIILLALVSTVFDFIFFGIFHKVQPTLLQTLWFIESIITEIALIFSIRTRHFFLKTKKPSNPLIILSLFTLVITLFLPFTNFGREFFHFTLPSVPALLIVFSLLISYFIVSEIVKLVYFRYWKNKNFANQKVKNKYLTKY